MIELILSSLINLQDLNTEVQVNICDVKKNISQKIDLPSWKQKKSILTYFVESSQLELYKQSWVFRIRIDLNKNKAEVTLKQNTKLNSNSQLLESKPIKCEYDLHGQDKKLACKMEHNLTIAEFDKARANNDWQTLLSPEQVAWLKRENVQIPKNLVFTSGFEENSYVAQKNEQEIEISISTNESQQEFIEASVRSTGQLELQNQQKLLAYLNLNEVILCENQSAILTRQKLESFFKNN